MVSEFFQVKIAAMVTKSRVLNNQFMPILFNFIVFSNTEFSAFLNMELYGDS